MNKKYAIFALIVLFVFLILFYRFYSEKLEKSRITEPVTDNYVLIDIGGKVHLYRDDILIQIYDNINPYSLPLQDRDNLKSGIQVKSIKEAAQLIEDFDG